MKVFSITALLFSTLACTVLGAADAAVGEKSFIEHRQAPGTGGAAEWAAASRALDKARSDSVQSKMSEMNQKIQEGYCQGANMNACRSCMDGYMQEAAGELLACGAVAFGIAAWSAGLGAFLAAAEFIGCEIAVNGRINEGWTTCVRV